MIQTGEYLYIMSKKVLITGANGLLGQKLQDHYSQKAGYKVLATGRGENRRSRQDAHISYQMLDISDRQQVQQVVANWQPNVIINSAAMTNVDACETDPEGCTKANVTAVEHLTEAAAEKNIFLLQLSTDFIFDGKNGPYKEDDEPAPVSFYGESKLKAEQIISNSSCRYAIARTVLVYGISEGLSRSNIILWVKESLEAGKTIYVVNDQWRTPTLAEDLAKGCFLIANQEAEGIFNISGKDFLTPYEMAIKTADFFDLNKSLIVETDGSRFTQKAKRPPRTGFVLDKARRVLGYEPVSFDEGIAKLARQMAATV